MRLSVVFVTVLVAAWAEEVEEDTREREVRAELPPPSRPQRPGGGAGFSSFLSGLLGSVTKTASVSACPGKCIHALASLMCDTVLEEVQCPTSNMRCCVERGNGMPPPPRDASLGNLNLGMPPRPSGSPPASSAAPREDNEEDEEEVTTEKEKEPEKKKKKKRRRTTTTTTTTTTTAKAEESTTSSPAKEPNKKDNDDEGESGSSNTSMSLSPPNLLLFWGLAAYVLTFLTKPNFCLI